MGLAGPWFVVGSRCLKASVAGEAGCSEALESLRREVRAGGPHGRPELLIEFDLPGIVRVRSWCEGATPLPLQRSSTSYSNVGGGYGRTASAAV